MQWAFLILAILAALAELHSGTFYLAAVAVAALLAAGAGVWINGDLLIVVFLLACLLLTGAVMLSRRSWAHGRSLADFDIGQTVSISSVLPHGHRLTVSYRGVQWEAEMADGAAVSPGDSAIIVGKTDKLLHLSLPSQEVL